MRTNLLASLAAASILVACATAKPVAIPASDLGLQKGEVLSTPVPPPLAVNESAPGGVPLPRPSYVGVAPIISHGIDGMVPITAKENACLACHAVAAKEKGGPTPVPKSHYVDMRNAPDRAGSSVSSTRYVCVSCHVESTGAKPLVRSDFAAQD
jgi:cytochrome c-type protein NapB